MNIEQAAMYTEGLFLERRHFLNSTEEVGHEHIGDMLDAIYSSNEMSDAKKNRWLGYVQGVMVSFGAATLEEMKEVNKKAAE